MPTIDFFRGKRVVDYKAGKGISDKVIYRLRWDYDTEETSLEELLQAWEKEPNVGEVTSLIIGLWGEEAFDDAPSDICQQLIDMAPKMPNLTGLVWGDIYYEECEISWIINLDVAPLIMAFPKLEYFKTRGGNNLMFSNLKHDKLKTLKVETGGLSTETSTSIMNAELPSLETLHLWLGSSYYGFNSSAEDFKPLIVGKAYPEMRYPFPKLKELGLCNSEIADDLAELMKDGQLMFDQLKNLNMSMGTMTDRGIEAFLENNHVGNIKKMDLSTNYIKDMDLIDQLRAKGLKVDVSGQKHADDDDDYYVDVSE